MSRSLRRSTRSRKVNTKYKNDGWSEEALQALGETSDNGDLGRVIPEAVVEEDEDFHIDDAQVYAADVRPDEDDAQMASESDSSVENLDSVDAEVEDVLGQLDNADEAERVIKKPKSSHPGTLHSRGIMTVERGRSNKQGAWQAMFGPTIEDLMPSLVAKELWLYMARDVTLPSWTTLEMARKKRLKLMTGPDKTQTSCGESISRTARQQQRLNHISIHEATDRQFVQAAANHEVILGPWTKQQAYSVPSMGSTPLGPAWPLDMSISGENYHSGWLLNVGEKPQCMAWAPNQLQEQYLAVTCRSTPQQRNTVLKDATTGTPAFTPSALYPTCVQIWRFAVVSGNGEKSYMDYTTPPQLSHLLVGNFGDVKQLDWAPEPTSNTDGCFGAYLGFLTLLTTDGCARVIQVPNKNANSTPPVCLEVLSPVFKLEPPSDSIFTCFNYASPTDLILGTTSGHVHIFNLSQTASFQQQLRPYYTHQIHQTYITSLATIQDPIHSPNSTPYAHSHFIGSLSAAGSTQLTDLRSPIQDTISIPRARLPTRNLIYHSSSRSFITTIDSSGNTEPRGNAQTTLSAHTFRHFYATTALSKFPEGSGTATSLAGSQVHPFILMGNSGGTVWSQNPIRRLFPGGRKGATVLANKERDSGSWVQKVVEYEWIPDPLNPSPPQQSPRDLYNGSPTRPGKSRITLGFRPENLNLSHQASKKRKVAGITSAVGSNSTNTVSVVFEEEQAVSCIAWNGNDGCRGGDGIQDESGKEKERESGMNVAGWCAIAWGSGIIMIMDLGHDAV